MAQSKEGKSEIKIKLDDETALGKYANLVFISHNPEEFVSDFIFLPPGGKQAQVISRIILSPGHAKRYAQALNENLDMYEKKHGKISPAENPDSKKIGF